MRSLFCVVFTGVWVELSLARRLTRRSTREPVDCTEMEDNLLCGSDGVTYLNSCDFYQAYVKNPELKMEEKGGCPCPPEDKFDWDPICGSNDELYANNCEFHRARKYDRFLRIRYLGLCKEFLESDVILYRDLQKIIKWKKFMPRYIVASISSESSKKKKGRVVDCTDMGVSLLCGSDAVTYLNPCEYQEARAKDPELTVEGGGNCPCSPRDKFDWNPICGTDDQLYANECELDRARNYIPVTAKHLGLCKEFMEREDILFRDLQKIYKWKNFMPRDLYNELESRPLVDDDERKPETTTRKKNRKPKPENTGEVLSGEGE